MFLFVITYDKSLSAQIDFINKAKYKFVSIFLPFTKGTYESI